MLLWSENRLSTWVDRRMRPERTLGTLEGLPLNDGKGADGTWGRVSRFWETKALGRTEFTQDDS